MTRLNLALNGVERRSFENGLLPIKEWQNRLAEMPAECSRVVTNEDFYAGCEGIGHDEEHGWYLVLWEPLEDPEPVDQPVGDSGLTIGVQVCNGPTARDHGKMTLLYCEHGL